MEHHEEGSFIHRYAELLFDPAHWAFEITLILLIDVVIVAMLYPAFKAWLAKHDREKHS